jgi:hypothetical protein
VRPRGIIVPIWAMDPACRALSTSSPLTDLVRWIRKKLDRLELSQGRFPEFAGVPQEWPAGLRALRRWPRYRELSTCPGL